MATISPGSITIASNSLGLTPKIFTANPIMNTSVNNGLASNSIFDPKIFTANPISTTTAFNAPNANNSVWR